MHECHLSGAARCKGTKQVPRCSGATSIHFMDRTGRSHLSRSLAVGSSCLGERSPEVTRETFGNHEIAHVDGNVLAHRYKCIC